MAKTISYRKGFVAMVAVVIIMMPTLALGSSLSLISSYSWEDPKFDPPYPPFGFDPNIPEASIEPLIGYILSVLGIDLMGSIYGPGISSWDNYVGFLGQDMYARASAVGTVAWVDPWEFGDTQYVKDSWLWAASYELDGNLGEEPVNVTYGYLYDYTYFNLAAIGRSRTSTDAGILYYIIPASLVGEYSPNAMYNWPFNIFAPNPLLDASSWGSLSLDFAKEYDIVGGFKESDGQQTGSKDLGTMGVGDRLYIIGGLGAYTECENYFEGLTVATMFASYTGSLYVEAVPEPSTFLLLGAGLAGVGLLRRRFKK